MSLSVKNITWAPSRKLAHATVGYILGPRGTSRKVALIVNEERNPRRPPGGRVPAKPVTLEIYLPLYPSQDRVLKFPTEAAAKNEAARLLALFISDAAEVL